VDDEGHVAHRLEVVAQVAGWTALPARSRAENTFKFPLALALRRAISSPRTARRQSTNQAIQTAQNP
jgi:hypothetical protein